MITMTNSTYNGWHFKKFINGCGTGTCTKCGDVKEFKGEFDPKPCKCGKKDE